MNFPQRRAGTKALSNSSPISEIARRSVSRNLLRSTETHLMQPQQ
jgi:hypothetical protein